MPDSVTWQTSSGDVLTLARLPVHGSGGDERNSSRCSSASDVELDTWSLKRRRVVLVRLRVLWWLPLFDSEEAYNKERREEG